MQGRKQILDIFSTFLTIEGGRTSWHVAAPLRRSMQSQLAEHASDSRRYWSLYWYTRWRDTEDSLALDHLRAYLQESCYWAMQKSMGGFAHGTRQVEDYFQIAIQDVSHILSGYDPQQGFSLENYASPIFRSALYKNLRQHHQIDICTPWSLLRRFSRKRLREALLQDGCTRVQIESRLLAWRCYRQIYTPSRSGANSLSRPDGATWATIAGLYGHEREPERHLQADGPEIERWMLAAAQALRNYQNPTIVSMNLPRAAPDQGEFLDLLVADEVTPLEKLSLVEEEQQRTRLRHQVGRVITEALSQLTPEVQELLELYYRQDLTQQQLAERLQTQQYTISRRLSRAKSQLLLAIATWAQKDLHVSTNPDVLEDMCQHLENWLSEYFSRREL